MKRKAFTLIELLVVIAIIAILAAILFPVFAQAKAAAPDYLSKEIGSRVAAAPVQFRLMLQVAGKGDHIDDPSIPWPDSRQQIELGTLSIDQLVPIARALGATLDQLVESVEDEDVVIRPRRDQAHGMTTWLLSRDQAPHGVTVAKMRITARRPPRELPVHPGRDWFTVLSGTARLQLGERAVLVEAGQAAQFSTMTPHAITAHGGPVEILTILDHDGQRAHLDAVDLTASG